MPKALKNDLATLARASRKQLVRAEQLGSSLDQRREYAIKRRVDMNGPGEEDLPWIPDEEWRKDFNNVNATIAQAGQSLIRALEGNKNNLGGVPTDQLEAQFKSEMIRAASNLSPEDWAILDKVRMGQVLAPPQPEKKPKR